ncbi:hypothetical protein HR060_04600 [Catenovulum sp. SM1970]|uniref:tetratricopeptide repeat protein n=1 Tax=Marinifaba aquimaris TaxID=2741323 RepID=UPI001571EEAA|nr:hypothetical protein [Marinifaba aquimaris]NTS76141.1 hypothetical protein [Marinifaba aquimaris]
MNKKPEQATNQTDEFDLNDALPEDDFADHDTEMELENIEELTASLMAEVNEQTHSENAILNDQDFALDEINDSQSSLADADTQALFENLMTEVDEQTETETSVLVDVDLDELTLSAQSTNDANSDVKVDLADELFDELMGEVDEQAANAQDILASTDFDDLEIDELEIDETSPQQVNSDLSVESDPVDDAFEQLMEDVDNQSLENTDVIADFDFNSLELDEAATTETESDPVLEDSETKFAEVAEFEASEFDDSDEALVDIELTLSDDGEVNRAPSVQSEALTVPDDFKFTMDELEEEKAETEQVTSADSNQSIELLQSLTEEHSKVYESLLEQQQRLSEEIQALSLSINALSEQQHSIINAQEQQQTETELPDAAKLFATGVYLAKENDQLAAAKQFRKAALLGHNKAMFYLGVMYSQGKGLPKSVMHSYVWLTLAILYGNSEATAARQALEKYLTAHEIHFAMRLAADRQELIFSNEQ